MPKRKGGKEVIKYEFTGETREFLGCTLKQIRAVRDFGEVKKGDVGGWIESENNLEHNGNAWVYGDALVYGNAWVCGDARVCGNDNIYIVGPIGSRGDVATFFKTEKNDIFVATGCFRGSIDELKLLF